MLDLIHWVSCRRCGADSPISDRNDGVSFIISFVGVQDADLSVLSQTMAQCCKNIKETVQMLASRHKDIHGSVSKVGKAIDRVSAHMRSAENEGDVAAVHVPSDMFFAEL